MAPRRGRRIRRVRNPVPVWIPLPRPCLRSLNIPGPPYCMPISPEMYLPPWIFPPAYFKKPMCHCTNEDFCTTNNCENSTECHKTHPMFCPHGIKHGEESDTRRNIVREQQQNNEDDQETSSNSDVCSTCGAHPNIHRKSNNKTNFGQDHQPRSYYTSKEENSQDTKGINSETKGIFNKEENEASQERDITTKLGETSLGIASSKNLNENGYESTSCQTSFSNSHSRGNNKLNTRKNKHLNSHKSNKVRSKSTTNYTEDSGNSTDGNVSTSSDSPKNIAKNESSCSSSAVQNNSAVNEIEQSLIKNKERSSSISNVRNKKSNGKTLETDNICIHVDRLPDEISNARKRQASKYSGCCFTGAEKSCEAAMDVDTMNKQKELPFKNIDKSRKKSECGCQSVSTSRGHKLSHCKCSYTKTSFKETSRFHKVPKCECYSNKMLHKRSSKSQKLSECGCSSAKMSLKSNSNKISECSCPSSKITVKPSSESSKTSKGVEEFSLAEGCVPKACPSNQLTAKKSNKSSKDVTKLSETNVRHSNCQCKFPPAYEHLSCTGNLNDNCNCNKSI